jgi:hypothetical protein
MVGRLLTVTTNTFARAAFLPQMQTIYCNWWDAEAPRKGSGQVEQKERRVFARKRFFFSRIIDDVEQLYARAVA